jgi:hypothetical protein
VAFVTFTNPSIKWEQLRTAALDIESNIWMFRTRASIYRDTDESGQLSDKLLGDILQEIKASVLEAADVKNTSFYSNDFNKNQHLQSPPPLNINEEKKKVAAEKEKKSMASNSNINVYNEMHNRDIEMGSNNETIRITESFIAPTITDCSLETIPDFKEFVKRYHNYHDLGIKLNDLIGFFKSNEGETKEIIDMHYEPIQPDMYIKYRVEVALEFYKSRIPSYSRTRNIAQTLIVSGAVGTGILAYAQQSRYATIISIITSSITAYLEFHGTNRKISRYSSISHSLQNVIVWWDTLPQIDRALVANIDKLVGTCEDLIQREREAWKSTSQTSKMLQKDETKEE